MYVNGPLPSCVKQMKESQVRLMDDPKLRLSWMAVKAQDFDRFGGKIGVQQKIHRQAQTASTNSKQQGKE